MIDRICEEINDNDVSLIATGGLSNLIIPHCKHHIIIDEKACFYVVF
ncbi:MAG: hypothetical protein L6U99_12550 [Clostridium sp.]|nr:MAG: hypothetical protein L6U99_12550 [Clostridium sp.]